MESLTFENIGTMIGTAVTTAAAMFFIVKYWQGKQNKQLMGCIKAEYEEKYAAKEEIKEFQTKTELSFKEFENKINLVTLAQANIQDRVENYFQNISKDVVDIKSDLKVLSQNFINLITKE